MPVRLGPSRQLVLHTLKRDVSFLSSHGLMDYSLLVAEEQQDPSTMLRFGPNPDVEALQGEAGFSQDLLSIVSLDSSDKYMIITHHIAFNLIE